MAMNCGISSGIDVSCESLRKVSGVKRLWIFNVNDIRVPIAADSSGTLSGYVSAIELNGYTGLYEFEAPKYSHQATSELTKADGGGVSYTQTVIVRGFNDSPTEDTALEDLAVADVVAVVMTANGEFKIYGATNGLNATADTETTGRALGEDTSTQVTLGGSEPKRYLRFSRGTAAQTLAYIEALAI